MHDPRVHGSDPVTEPAVDFEALRPLLQELDQETQQASAAAQAGDWDTWTKHAFRGAELHEQIAHLVGWRNQERS